MNSSKDISAAAKAIQGTPVYSAGGERLGAIQDVLLDEGSGKATYALLAAGWVPDGKETCHPLPWSALHFDPDRGGYVVRMTRRQLQRGPQLPREDSSRLKWRPYEEEVYGYYGIRPYWK